MLRLDVKIKIAFGAIRLGAISDWAFKGFDKQLVCPHVKAQALLPIKRPRTEITHEVANLNNFVSLTAMSHVIAPLQKRQFAIIARKFLFVVRLEML